MSCGAPASPFCRGLALPPLLTDPLLTLLRASAGASAFGFELGAWLCTRAEMDGMFCDGGACDE
jgi:hypothetical protein